MTNAAPKLTKPQIRALELLQLNVLQRTRDGTAWRTPDGDRVSLSTIAALRRRRLVVRSRNHLRCWIPVALRAMLDDIGDTLPDSLRYNLEATVVAGGEALAKAEGRS